MHEAEIVHLPIAWTAILWVSMMVRCEKMQQLEVLLSSQCIKAKLNFFFLPYKCVGSNELAAIKRANLVSASLAN